MASRNFPAEREKRNASANGWMVRGASTANAASAMQKTGKGWRGEACLDMGTACVTLVWGTS